MRAVVVEKKGSEEYIYGERNGNVKVSFQKGNCEIWKRSLLFMRFS